MEQARNSSMAVAASVQRGATVGAGKGLSTHYTVEARDAQGALKWLEEFDNLVVTDGLNDSLTQHLKGSNYTAAWYVGLTTGSPTFAGSRVTVPSRASWLKAAT